MVISKTMEIMVFVEVDMHKIFGIKEDKIYLDRKGAYLVPIRGEKVGVVETTKGYFLLGGTLHDSYRVSCSTNSIYLFVASFATLSHNTHR